MARSSVATDEGTWGRGGGEEVVEAGESCERFEMSDGFEGGK